MTRPPNSAEASRILRIVMISFACSSHVAQRFGSHRDAF